MLEFLKKMHKTKYLIIGGSAAGVSAANALAKLEPGARIVCVTAELVRPYNKCFLVDWLAGEKTASQLDLQLNPQVELLLGLKVISLDVQAKVAQLSNGASIRYDKALLAIGAQAFRPQIPGLLEATHVFNFHDYQDVASLASFIAEQKPKTAVVIGAGLTGLEAADALWRLGLQVTILERSGQVLGKLVDQDGAHKLAALMSDSGVRLYTNSSVQLIESRQVVLDSGEGVPADLVLVAAGVRPNQLTILGGVLAYFGSQVQVNDFLQTNLPDLWAAGDLVAVPEVVTGQILPSSSWPDAMMQGHCAAQNMAEVPKLYPGMLQVANSHFFGQDLISFGCLEQTNGLLALKSQVQAASNSYQKLVLDQANQLKAALLIGDTTLYPALRRAVLTKQPWLN